MHFSHQIQMEGPPEFELEVLPSLSFDEDPRKKHAFKHIHKRVVCRYWLNNCCKKGEACEFLHSFEQDKMPECRKGEFCGDPSCILSHPSKQDKPVCPNFAAGFCSFGFSCPLQHVFVEGAPPAVASMFLASDPAKAWIASRKQTQKSFRKAECPYFLNDGWCPYFLSCAFSHEPVAKKLNPRTQAAPVVFDERNFPPLPFAAQQQRPMAVAPLLPPPSNISGGGAPLDRLRRPPVQTHEPPHGLPPSASYNHNRSRAPNRAPFQEPRGNMPFRGSKRGRSRGGFSHEAGQPFHRPAMRQRGPDPPSAARPAPQHALVLHHDTSAQWSDMV